MNHRKTPYVLIDPSRPVDLLAIADLCGCEASRENLSLKKEKEPMYWVASEEA